VLGQCVFSVVFRVLLVRLALWQQGSMWPAVAAHAAYNLAWSLSPTRARDTTRGSLAG